MEGAYGGIPPSSAARDLVRSIVASLRMSRESRPWRRHLRGIVDHVSRATLQLSRFERRMRRRPTLLMYHRILPQAQCGNYPFPALVMPEDAFEEQVAWLARHAEVVTATDASQRIMSRRESTGRPVVAITFDDGYADNFTIAAPILERHGVHGTFYLASDFVGADRLLWYDHAALLVAGSADELLRLSAASCGIGPPSAQDLAASRVAAWVELLKRTAPAARSHWIATVEAASPPVNRDNYRAMRPEEAAGLARRGHEIGSHSVAHEILPLLDDDALAFELNHSREVIAEWVGDQVPGFCYPNGSCDERVVAATRAAGYDYACTTNSPHGDPMDDVLLLGRVDLNHTRVSRPSGRFDLVAFRAEICGLHDRMR